MVLVISALAVLAPVTAWADEQCGQRGTSELITVSGWEIEPIDERTNRLDVTIASHAEKDIRMIDASVGFTDALGGHIASYALDRDIVLTKGGEHTDTGRWGPSTFERLLNLRPEETEAYVCVRAVLYEDGTKEEF